MNIYHLKRIRKLFEIKYRDNNIILINHKTKRIYTYDKVNNTILFYLLEYYRGYNSLGKYFKLLIKTTNRKEKLKYYKEIKL